MKSLQACRSGKDFLRLAETAERNGKCKIRNGKGSHAVITTEQGAVVIPRHNDDLGIGLRKKLCKWFVILGLALLVLALALIIL